MNNDNITNLCNFKKYNPLSHVFIISFFIPLIIAIFISHSYYNDDIIKYRKAANNEIKLYPATQQEIDRWDKKSREIEIEYKRKEILALQMGLKLSDDADEAMINHYSNYPDGHNPPQQQLQKLLDGAYHNRNILYKYSLFFSVGFSLIFTIVYYFGEKKNKR